MADYGLGIVEMSLWSRNRRHFIGKRDEKFLYWRCEGWILYSRGMKVAAAGRPGANGMLAPNADAGVPEAATTALKSAADRHSLSHRHQL